MGKIQDALSRLRENKNSAESMPTGEHEILPESASSELSTTAARPPVWDYGGREVQIDETQMVAAGLLEPVDSEKSIIGEYRPIRHVIAQGAEAGVGAAAPGNLVMISSSVAKEGKTFVSLNLAMSLARDPKHSVVLVDGDADNQRLSEVFGAKSEKGLTDWIDDPSIELQDIIMPTNIADFAFLPIGRLGQKSISLLSGENVADRLAAVSALDTKRIFLFDSSAVLAEKSATALVKHVGKVLFIVCAGKTRRSSVRNALRDLGSDRPVKLILNQMLT